MGREPKEREILGCKVKCTPLPFKVAEDHLPDVSMIYTAVVERATEKVDPSIVAALKGGKIEALTETDLLKLLPAITPIAMTVFRSLSGGVLQRIAPAIFSSVIVTATNPKGELEKYELQSEARRGEFFDQHPETYYPLLFFAGSTTYLRFFPVKDLLAKLSSAKTAAGEAAA